MINSTDYSLHTHTIGFDGCNTPEQMVIAARQHGMKTIMLNKFVGVRTK